MMPSPQARSATRADELAYRVAATFPTLTDRGRLIALETYRTLAFGDPVPDYAIAAATGLEIQAVTAEMADWPGIYRSDSGRIVGFWGLALDDTGHSFVVNGVQLYTWCAWDTLFLPELLGQRAVVHGESSVTGEEILIEVGEAVHADPATAAVSFIDPGRVHVDGEKIISTFCHHILFFSTREEGMSWAEAADKDVLILPIEEAFQVGRAFNARRFGRTIDATSEA